MFSNYKKIFFWSFGFIFSVFIYILVYSTRYFLYLRENNVLLFSVMLFVLLLFFFIGLFASKISLKSYFKSSEFDFIKLEKQADIKKNKRRLKQLISNLNTIYNYNRFRQIPLNSITEYTGLEKKTIKKFINKKDFLLKIKYVYWILGFVVSVVFYFLFSNISYLSSIIDSSYILFFICFVIFFLFFAEGILVTRLPVKYYLNLLDFNYRKKVEYEKEIKTSNEIIKGYRNKEEKSINIIKNVITYLRDINVSRTKIKEFLRKEDFSKEEIKNILNYSINLKRKINIKKKASKKNMKNLFLSRMHEEFKSLRGIYSKINKINDDIKDVKEDINKVKTLYNNSIKELDNTKKNIKNQDKSNLAKIKKEYKKYSKKLEKIRRKKIYNKLVLFLYTFLKPYASQYSKDEIEGFLLSKNYNIAVIEDVFEKFKQNNIKFADNKNSFSDKLVFFVNNLYFKFSKNKGI